MKNNIYDLVGIGIGPFNLSLAALLKPSLGINSLFLEKQAEVSWHTGQLFPFSSLTVSFLKDLVTLADPQSEFSFINYLFSNKRIYQFISANLPRVSRLEFEQYMQWVSHKLPNLKFKINVNRISHHNNKMIVETDDQKFETKHLVLGHGMAPFIPDFAKPHIGNSVFHAGNYLNIAPDITNKTIAVVGGGQTAAEVVLHLLTSDPLPEKIIWICPRTILWPLDETPFSNEMYTPNFGDYFFDLETDRRLKILSDLRYTGDGITQQHLNDIYQAAYKLKFIKGIDVLKVKLAHVLENILPEKNKWKLEITETNRDIKKQRDVDIVVLATGFKNEYPEFMKPLKDLIPWNDGFSINKDFSIQWNLENENKIFIQSTAKKTHGIADPYFSLMAWRSAQIINSLNSDVIYHVDKQQSLLHW